MKNEILCSYDNETKSYVDTIMKIELLCMIAVTVTESNDPPPDDAPPPNEPPTFDKAPRFDEELSLDDVPAFVEESPFSDAPPAGEPSFEGAVASDQPDTPSAHRSWATVP